MSVNRVQTEEESREKATKGLLAFLGVVSVVLVVAAGTSIVNKKKMADRLLGLSDDAFARAMSPTENTTNVYLAGSNPR